MGDWWWWWWFNPTHGFEFISNPLSVFGVGLVVGLGHGRLVVVVMV